VEDFSAPAHLCPVCLRKLQFRLGFDICERYEGLLALFEKWRLAPEARWISDRLRSLRATPPEPSQREEEGVVDLSTERGKSGKKSRAVAPSARPSRKRKNEALVLDLTSP
jgi:hypothetical protein